MENVHAAISAPSPVPAKSAAPEAPADAEGAPLPGAFLAVLSHQVKNLKSAPVLDPQATDAKTIDADPGLAATDPTLAAEPVAIDLQMLVGLPPALPGAATSTASDAATTEPAADGTTATAAAAVSAASAAAAASTVAAAAAASTVAAAAASAVALAATTVAAATTAAPVASAVAAVAAPAVAAAVSAPAATLSPAPVLTQSSAAKPALSTPDSKPAPAPASGSAQDAARKSITDDTPAPRAMPARDAVAASTAASLAAHGEVLRAAEHAPSIGADGRESNSPSVPQLAFTQVLSDTRAASTVAPAAQLQVDTQVGAAGWGTELGQKVVWMVNEKQQVAELRVNPPDLGPLDIKLTIDDGHTTAVFTSPHSSVRDAVESALPRLREVLAESGIMLGNASVTSDSPRDGSAFAQPPARNLAATRDESQSDAVMRLATGAGDTARGRGLVDLFA
jgi:flagellar hook-length control protein FliK